ncbi:hypothetical protein KFE25_004512 [Diacronema lutheri]|uniref:Uncharacterized protein n=1 Tax=Diacronema lutheri TaxID=2081491 RepID=A0A8J5XGC4_DIALT|nr:hypothetical protein KFE25_004512 [Diacronema lutheri]
MGRLELGRAPALNPNASASAWVRRTTKEDTALFNLVANLSREPGHPIAYLRASHAAGALELDAASAAETAPSGGARRASTPSDAGARARGMAAATMGMASMEPGADAPVDDARSVATRGYSEVSHLRLGSERSGGDRARTHAASTASASASPSALFHLEEENERLEEENRTLRSLILEARIRPTVSATPGAVAHAAHAPGGPARSASGGHSAQPRARPVSLAAFSASVRGATAAAASAAAGAGASGSARGVGSTSLSGRSGGASARAASAAGAAGAAAARRM